MTEASKQRVVWIMAGESSGDLYGARIAEELKRQDPNVVVRGMGGVKMKAADVDCFIDSSELGVVGLIEVLGSIGTFVRLLFDCVRRAKRERPDVVLMVDYPGFNIRLAKRLWKIGVPVVWYIGPQVWAWRKSNIPKYARYCRKMIVIFPFEPEVWAGSGLDVEFAGHPLIEIVRERTDPNIRRDPNRLLLMPGSRKSETSRLLEPFLETALILKKRHPGMTFSLAAPRERTYRNVLEGIEVFAKKRPEVRELHLDVLCGQTARAMQECGTGLAASGTVTVESAVAGLPLVVAYRLHPLTFLLARIIIRKLFRNAFTMVNIILNRTVFEEFLQFQVVPEDLADAVDRVLPGGPRRRQVEADMEEMKRELSCGAEKATANAARIILQTIPR